MELDYSEEYWRKPCPQIKCKKPPIGLVFVSIPASLGDDTVLAPANGAVYIYSCEGVPVLIREGQ